MSLQPVSADLVTDAKVKRVPLPDIARMFLLLGVLGFGGPAAHIALMERELVTRRGWLSRQHFLDLLAAINLVPGPTSTEMAFYIGYATGGIAGAILSGMGFIIPAAIFSIALAMLYTTAGSIPAVRGLFIGVQPVVLVLILSAAYRLAQKALDSTLMLLLFGVALLLVALSSTIITGWFGATPVYVPELILLLATGAIYVVVRRRRTAAAMLIPCFPFTIQLSPAFAEGIPGAVDLFWRFMVIGGTLFGSGYVISAYLQRTFVDGLHWLTPTQLVDVLAIGQSTPGPVLSTASAAGYVMTATPGLLWSGVPGAIASTIGVFLPAFVIVLILGKVVPILYKYPVALDFLKGVNGGVIALLVGAFFNLAWATLVRPGMGLRVDWLSLLLTILAFGALERLKWSPVLLIAVGVGVGLVRIALGLV